MTQNTINFNSVKEIGLSFESVPFGFAGTSGVDPEFGGAINAVDIDWNGAKPGMGEDSTNGITTTGELIKGVYSPVFAKAA